MSGPAGNSECFPPLPRCSLRVPENQNSLIPAGPSRDAQWSEHSPPTNVAQARFRPGAKYGLSLLLVLALLQGFSSAFSFPPQKKKISKFQFDQIQFDQHSGIEDKHENHWKPKSDVASSQNYYLIEVIL